MQITGFSGLIENNYDLCAQCEIFKHSLAMVKDVYISSYGTVMKEMPSVGISED